MILNEKYKIILSKRVLNWNMKTWFNIVCTLTKLEWNGSLTEMNFGKSYETENPMKPRILAFDYVKP